MQALDTLSSIAIASQVIASIFGAWYLGKDRGVVWGILAFLVPAGLAAAVAAQPITGMSPQMHAFIGNTLQTAANLFVGYLLLRSPAHSGFAVPYMALTGIAWLGASIMLFTVSNKDPNTPPTTNKSKGMDK